MFIMHNDVMVRCVISGEYKEHLTTMGWSESSEDLVKNDTRVEKNTTKRTNKNARITKGQTKE